MDDDQQFCLRWNNHQSTLISVFDTLLENETLVDCTLAAEGRFMKAHKVVLSACSPYFATLLQQQYDKHPIFILKDVKYQELRAMMDYMYRGEVNISQDQLAALLKAAESLQIKGLSDNRSGGSGAGSAPRQEIPHQRASIPGGKHGYTLEQTKRARLGPGSGIEQQEIVSGSREGSSSPSRRRRKPRRRSIDNDVHDNSNSSANQQPNASLAGSAITASALASQMTVAAAAAAAASAVVSPAALASAVVSSQQQSGTQQQQAQLTTNVPKKTETIKGTTSDAMNNENIQATTSGTAIVGSGAAGVVIGSGAATVAGGDEQDNADKVEQKSNHKQKSSNIGKDASTIPSGELTIEPKSEYDDEGNDENVEDLTLDEEEMGMDDLDHNAGTSQGGEGSSQGYAAWQHDNRSQDELLLTTQDAQQRDPQDLSKKIAQLHKENTAPAATTTAVTDSVATTIRKTHQRSILNINKRHLSRNSLSGSNDGNQTAADQTSAAQNGTGQTGHTTSAGGVNRKRLSMSEVSDMLFELYRANVAKAPKNQQQAQPQQQQFDKFGRQTSPTSAETNEPSTIAAIATNGAAETASKNLKGDEMVSANYTQEEQLEETAAQQESQEPLASFHPRIKYTLKPNPNSAASDFDQDKVNGPVMTAIPTSVLVPTSPQIDVKPLIHPTTGMVISPPAQTVIKSVPSAVNPQAAAIAAALIRDGYHSFQQQIRAQEILKHHYHHGQQHQQQQQQRKPIGVSGDTPTPTKILENLLRQQQRDQRHSECENEPDNISENNDGDDEDDSRFNGFDDIHLMEHNGKVGGSSNHSFTLAQAQNALAMSGVGGGAGDEDSQKLLFAQAQAQVLRNLDFSMGDYGNSNASGSMGAISPTAIGPDGEPVYECRHCGKKYRWKSTLRRHENVECGGKEPSHQCPYCPYKSKQRGNLGVHVRKHHSNLPQLASKRRSKYSNKYDDSNAGSMCSGSMSDDSQSKLVIDCSK